MVGVAVRGSPAGCKLRAVSRFDGVASIASTTAQQREERRAARKHQRDYIATAQRARRRLPPPGVVGRDEREPALLADR